jgi:hypothetical protein
MQVNEAVKLQFVGEFVIKVSGSYVVRGRTGEYFF